jgi:hypothetical protein
MTDAGGIKPVCEFCEQRNTVIQKSVYGVLHYLHPWCVDKFRKFTEPTVTLYAKAPPDNKDKTAVHRKV